MAKVAVALSGGVDSSVAALLLKEAGHQVLGLSLRLGAGADLAWRDGAVAAQQVGIPHRVVEAAGEFGERVLEPVARAYAAGRTPNPCGWCNARVKFPLLWRAAQEDGCQHLATGHYARVVQDNGRWFLAEAADAGKSQAYFLARLAPELLPRLLFPLGGLRKEQVRQMAAAAGLQAAQRPESQDMCFLPVGGWDQFMAQRQGVRPGPLKDQQGRVLGEHAGLHRYTVGQRRGLGLALGQPMYVTALDGPRAAVTVGPRPSLATRGLAGRRPLWYAPLDAQRPYTVRFRYSHRGVACRVRGDDRTVEVSFAQEQGAVAPGQLAVFFKDRTIMGSAWIVKAFPSNHG
ncbi:MAG: tRNA 2-thiouridine(34) synthase MnmA [Thermodesulfobacteriota bacterium]